ncbi:hypothetical protein C0995_007237 [Termitomyces sp. Mi166|nr:hypothetical protein C0995_007237 [Termitomyces sp. Mi166\
MTLLFSFVSVVFLVASLPDVLAGPACTKRFYKHADCLSKCKDGWGWSNSAMGTDRWGAVMRKMPSDETLNDVLHRACGFQPSSTSSHPIGNAQTGSVTLSSTANSSVVGTPSFPTSAFSATPLFSSSSVLNTSVTSRHHVSMTSTKPFTTFTAPPAPPKTSSTPSSSRSTTSGVHHVTTIKAPPPTTTAALSGGNSSGGSTTSGSDVQAYLSAHNTVRAQHGAAPLTWSDNLASKAQTWADKCVFKHSGGSLGPYGENLAAGTDSSYGIQAAIKSWTDEASEYNPAHPVYSHFTQVVWKSTTQVGCAVQLCDGIFSSSYGKAKYYVCEYSPAGNIIGEFAENVTYTFVVLVTIVAVGLSCSALLAQAVRTSPKKSWKNNVNAFIIGASYAVVLVASLLYCGKRRIAMRLRLHRISKSTKSLTRGDMPNVVHKYVAQEYIRACLVSYESLPRDAFHEGWGRPGTKYDGIRFRRALLDTILEIDELAHIVIPTHPAVKPHARMLHHFRFILPLLPVDSDGLTPLHYYDSAVQLARNGGAGALGEQEFEIGIGAAEEILKWKQILGSLDECRLEMIEGSSSTRLSLASSDSLK